MTTLPQKSRDNTIEAMENDALEQAQLDALPSFVSISPMLKATPATEGDRRYVYVEASNESVDQQGEIVLCKALENSMEYFQRFGNLDLEHYTQIGARAGIPNHESYEIGTPVDVRIQKSETFVKGEIYQGSGKMAEKANLFWSSLTEISPPKKWFTSVGGAVLEKSMQIDPASKSRVPVIERVRWSNLAFSATPVNANLRPASLVPFGPLAKSWGAYGLDVVKSLQAGYGTDSATLTGGPAISEQSLDDALYSYWNFRDDLANAIGNEEISMGSLKEMVREAGARFGLSKTVAADYVKRFLDDLKRG
jgi:hypothetical protein